MRDDRPTLRLGVPEARMVDGVSTLLAVDPAGVGLRLRHLGGADPRRGERRGPRGLRRGPQPHAAHRRLGPLHGGPSVLHFLRVRTWLELESGAGVEALARDAAALGRLEGLEARARAAERRLGLDGEPAGR